MLEELEALRLEEDGGRRSEHHRKSDFALDCALFPEIASDQAVLHQIETRILVRELGHKYDKVEDIAHEATAIFIEKVANGSGAEGGGPEVMGSSSKNKYNKGGEVHDELHAVVNDSEKLGGTGSEGEGSMEIQRGVEFEKIGGLEEKDSMEISSGQGKAVIESQNVGSVDSNKEVDGPKIYEEGSEWVACGRMIQNLMKGLKMVEGPIGLMDWAEWPEIKLKLRAGK
nr:hypothetical protein Iba_chr03aCG4080 [Ipomoea batatas]GMC71769.1 hypothetical protein Iba_chr03bCG5650 [Ipomoea batatas]